MKSTLEIFRKRAELHFPTIWGSKGQFCVNDGKHFVFFVFQWAQRDHTSGKPYEEFQPLLGAQSSRPIAESCPRENSITVAFQTLRGEANLGRLPSPSEFLCEGPRLGALTSRRCQN